LNHGIPEGTVRIKSIANYAEEREKARKWYQDYSRGWQWPRQMFWSVLMNLVVGAKNWRTGSTMSSGQAASGAAGGALNEAESYGQGQCMAATSVGGSCFTCYAARRTIVRVTLKKFRTDSARKVTVLCCTMGGWKRQQWFVENLGGVDPEPTLRKLTPKSDSSLERVSITKNPEWRCLG
jgi:hypothetical protein